MIPSEANITELLSALANGNPAATEKLMPIVYGELKRLARAYLRRERPNHTLQTTALVHEAYLRLVKQEPEQWQGRSHFFGIAAQLMRRILVDHARAHLRKKRGGAAVVVPLDEVLAFSPEHSQELIRLDEALKRLTKLDPRQSRIVELRFFGGMTVEETANYLRISPKTVKRDWAVAKVWLHAEVRGSSGDHSRPMATR